MDSSNAHRKPTGIELLLLAAEILDAQAPSEQTSNLQIAHSPVQASIRTSEDTKVVPKAVSPPPSTSIPPSPVSSASTSATTLELLAIPLSAGPLTRNRAAQMAGRSPTTPTTPTASSSTKGKAKASPRAKSVAKAGTKKKSGSAMKRSKSLPLKVRPRWKCTVVGCTAAIYPRRHDIDRHMKTHLPPSERPFHCEFPGCDFSTVQMGNLRTHQATHEGECTPCEELLEDGTVCSFKCTDPGQMTRHKQSRHNWPSRASSASTPSLRSDSMESENSSPSSTALSSPLSSPDMEEDGPEFMLIGPGGLLDFSDYEYAAPSTGFGSFPENQYYPETSLGVAQEDTPTFCMPTWA